MSHPKLTKDFIHLLLERHTFVEHRLDDELVIQDIGWKLDGAKRTDVIFYRLNVNNEGQYSLFLQRCKENSWGLLILNEFPKKEDLVYLKNVLIIRDKDDVFLQAQKSILDEIYPLDLKNKKLVGITGTNGKSTTVELGRQLALEMGHKACSIGTLGVKDWRNQIFPTESALTTPPLIELQKLLHKLLMEEEHDACFMEVSSHALVNKRVYGLKFHAIAWTSFGQDHLDFHSSMEEYFQAKKLLYKDHLFEGGAFCVPSEEKELRDGLKDCKIHEGRSLNKRTITGLPAFLRTTFNRNNLEVALDLNEFLWKKDAPQDLNNLQSVAGRFSLYKIGEKFFIIDYAHTPDALERICENTRTLFSGSRLFILFGCGGDRDPFKRPLMGNVAFQYGDYVVLTSDNPRSEDPDKIIEDICRDMGKFKNKINGRVIKIADRRAAIYKAFEGMNDRDVLIIAGKGHEDYQIIGNVRHHFSDWEVLKQLAAENGRILEDGNGRNWPALEKIEGEKDLGRGP